MRGNMVRGASALFGAAARSNQHARRHTSDTMPPMTATSLSLTSCLLLWV
jgi:hypothetical protein